MQVSHVAFACASLLVVTLAIIAGVLFASWRSKTEVIAKLEQERSTFESSLDRLNHRLSRFESEADRLATEMGLAQPPGVEPAAGGALRATATVTALGRLPEEETGFLSARAEALSRSMDGMELAWADRVLRLNAVPSGTPSPGIFSHGYGWRKDPFTGKREFHYGVDIVADTGTPILATANGVVTHAGRWRGYGKMVHVSHGFGRATRYAHMSEILVRPGQVIRRGDVLGRVGSTGRSTGPHLHYEVLRDGRHEDPREYLGDKSF